jgi:two-component sensor histidine kinase
MKQLVEAELAPYAEGGRIKIAGGKVTLSSSAALSFAMIVHELATNAAKYGALSRDAGRLEVSWSNSDPDKRFVLDWTERGGPALGNPPLRRGFGLGLIERSVTRDLQGIPTIDFARTGLRVRIDVPLGEIKARNEV